MGLILSLFVSAVLGVLYSLAAYWAIRSRRVSQAHRLKRLSQSAIFRSSWKMGLALFGMNGVFFFGTIAAILGSNEITDLFRVPSPIVLIAPLAIAASLLLWLWFGNTCKGIGRGGESQLSWEAAFICFYLHIRFTVCGLCVPLFQAMIRL